MKLDGRKICGKDTQTQITLCSLASAEGRQRETVRKGCPYTIVLRHLLAIRMTSCDPVHPGAMRNITNKGLHYADSQLVTYQNSVAVALLIMVRLMPRSSSLILRSLKEKNRQAWEPGTSPLVNLLTTLLCRPAGIWRIPQFSSFYLLSLTLLYIMVAIPLSKQEWTRFYSLFPALLN